MSSALGLPRPQLRSSKGWAAGVGLLGFAVGLSTVLRGSGLYGRFGYDGAVYYASASALSHGLLPYRDYLVLHPPGITLALLPFAALGQVVADADAYALARLAWIGLGAITTVLVFAIVRPLGRWPAVATGTFYAIFTPAVIGVQTTSLEAVGSVCLAGALALLTRANVRAGTKVTLVVAGGLLGLSAVVKIWGVVPAVVLVSWVARRRGTRQALLVLAGATGVAVAVCLPFFIAAPGSMWRMVVVDQLGRGRVSHTLAGRVIDIAGLSELYGKVGTLVLVAVALVASLPVLLLAVREPLGRLAALLLAVTVALLLSTPPWSVAYTGLSAPVVAVLFGCAVAGLTRLRTRLVPVGGLLVVVGLIAYGSATLTTLPAGSPFPGRSLEQLLARSSGCVTTDDPIALIETGALQRNFDRRCPTVVDLSGYSWDLQPSARLHLSRPRNAQFQRLLLHHLGSGETSIIVRFRTTPGLSDQTKKAISSWPVVGKALPYEVRHPVPQTVSPIR